MAVTDLGAQRIGWKYSTPLQAEYLNTFNSGLSNPGLITRPNITVDKVTNVGCTITIRPFSMYIVPADKVSTVTDENGKRIVQTLVKISITNPITLTVNDGVCAIGFRYTFANGLIPQSQWFGEFVQLNKTEVISTFDGIIIATVQCFRDPDKEDKLENYKFSVTTSGADISDVLLASEGWNPTCWLSLISPRRATNGILNKLEVRCHNDVFANPETDPHGGYISGVNGVVRLSSLLYTFDTLVDDRWNPNGIRGFMPNNFNAFNIQSTGFSLCNGSDELPITNQAGGIFALADAIAVNNYSPDHSSYGNLEKSFANRVLLMPVQREDLNVWIRNKTLVID